MSKHKDLLFKGDIVVLKERFRISAMEAYDGVATIYFDIYLTESGERVGTVEFRLNIEGDMYYYGHVGYRIKKDHQGHSYAYQACLVLFDHVREEFGFDEIIITCSPDNLPSKRTLEKLGGKLIETVDVPKDHPLYLNNEKVKCIYAYRMKDGKDK